MKKQTKTPKEVEIHYCPTGKVQYYQKYVCPSCKTTYQGYDVSENTDVFRCECGQLLKIIDRVYETK